MSMTPCEAPLNCLDTNPSSIVIVGNGPIQNNNRTHIDGATIVVRMNRFRIEGFELRAGTRTDVYATWPTVWEHNLVTSQLAGSLEGLAEIWIPRPRDWCNRAVDGLLASSRVPIWFMPAVLWARLLRSGGAGNPVDGTFTMGDKRPQGPSTGLTTILLALARFPSTQLTVTGFDLDPPDEHYDCYFEENCWVQPAHPWTWEKRLLRHLATAGRITIIR